MRILRLPARHEGLVVDGMYCRVGAHLNEVGKHNFEAVVQVLIDEESVHERIHFDNDGKRDLLKMVADYHYSLNLQHLH